MESVSTRALRLAGLDGLAAVGGPFAAPTLMLVQNNFTPNENLVPGDLTVATFDGYANEAGLTANSAYIDVFGRARISFPSVHFEATGGVTPNVLYGWALLNVGLTAVHAAALFDEPISIAAANDGVDVLPSLVWGN